MQESRWDKVYDFVDNKFGIIEESGKEIEIKKGVKGKEEMIVFQSPKGKMKLVRLIKPRVIDIKYHYSRRTNRGAYQDAYYSPTETVEIIKLYQWDQRMDKWREINFSGLQ